MLQERLRAAYAVRDAFLPLKLASGELTERAGECLKTMVAERKNAGLKIGDGADAYAAVAEAAALFARAEGLIASAHPVLATLIEQAGLSRHYAVDGSAYGDEETKPFTSAALRAA